MEVVTRWREVVTEDKPERLCFSRAGGAALPFYHRHLLMATATPRNRSLSRKNIHGKVITQPSKKGVKILQTGEF